MKNIIHSLYAGTIILLLVGCTTTQEREGYATWDYEFIVKDSENTLYVPIITYGGIYDGKLKNAPLYKITSNSLIKSAYVLHDFTSSVEIEYLQPIDSNYSYVHGINVDNKIQHILCPITDYGTCIPLVKDIDTDEISKLEEYVSTYYEGKLDVKEILSEIRLQMPSDSTQLDLRISLYSEGMYILYSSKETVDYKSKTTKVPISGSIEPKGYYVSYYRYYPVATPKKFSEIKLPFLVDIENL